ncbi:MAG: class I SAM-dependent methyltransferase [Minisyncoccia bacterium]
MTMHPDRDTAFYNEASTTYSSERYPAAPRSYRQFFFTRRLAVLVREMKPLLTRTNAPLSLLEVGCADGIVLRTLYDTFGPHFRELHGNDVSPGMIASAKHLHADTPLTFSVRTEEPEGSAYDMIIETGVINYTDPATEIGYAASALKDAGSYILSYAGKGSLWDFFKPGRKGYQNLLPYPEFEALIQNKFEIEKTISIGFFVPLLWRLPFLAAPVQAVVELLGSHIMPNLAHEKMYLLKKII